jgi:hypothetical protein
MRFPRRGGFWGHQPGQDRRPGQSFDGRQVDPHRGGRLPFPDQRDPVARDQLGREHRIPSPVAKREEHLENVAVGAARLVRGQTVQYPLDQLPDAVLPQIAGLSHRDQGCRVHEETPNSPVARFRAAAPGPRRKSSDGAAGRSGSGWRESSDPSLYRRVVCSTGTWRLSEPRRLEGRIRLSSGRSSSLGATTGIGGGEKAASSNCR